MNDYIMNVLIYAGIAGAVGLVIYNIWLEYRRRKLTQQIRDNIVPVDYDQVAKRAREMNDQIELGNPDFRKNTNDLRRLRENVAIIRLDGFDRAVSDAFKGLKFTLGVSATPHPKGSGEAKQWVRGYCQGANVSDIERYYRAA